jgi:hypothetical protein
MPYRLAAEATLLVHLGFIVFVMLGGLLAWRWCWIVLVHLPAAAWGAFVELSGRLCPLTTLENHFRRGRAAGYSEASSSITCCPSSTLKAHARHAARAAGVVTPSTPRSGAAGGGGASA